jgi:predicted ArsR family transcriptional regulator
MPTRTEYQNTLERLVGLLREKPLTAREIAQALGCCKPAAYQRLRALQKRGEVIYSIRSREACRPGPLSTAYGIR